MSYDMFRKLFSRVPPHLANQPYWTKKRIFWTNVAVLVPNFAIAAFLQSVKWEMEELEDFTRLAKVKEVEDEEKAELSKWQYVFDKLQDLDREVKDLRKQEQDKEIAEQAQKRLDEIKQKITQKKQDLLHSENETLFAKNVRERERSLIEDELAAARKP